MNLEEYTALLESPLSVEKEDLPALQNLLKYAPYCVSARLLLLKGLFEHDQQVEANRQLQRAILAAPPEVSVYFLLNPKKIKRPKTANTPKGEIMLSYFELIDRMQEVSQKTGVSFEELAQRYLEARQYMVAK